MTTSPNSLLADIADLIRAASSLLWPALGFYVLIRHEKQLKDVFGRLRKGKLFGQEIELDSSLKELERQVSLVKEESVIPEAKLPSENDSSARAKADDISTDDDFVGSILSDAIKSPTVALIRLATEIERLCNGIWADLNDGSHRTRPSVRHLIDGLAHVLPQHVPSALRAFWDVRNRIVHGRDADDDEVISAIDSGLALWKALTKFSRSYAVVVRSAIPIYADAEGRVPIEGATGVELRFPNTSEEDDIFPTTQTGYQPQMVVHAEWGFDRTFGEVWCRDMLTDEMRQVWISSADFVGSPIRVNLRS